MHTPTRSHHASIDLAAGRMFAHFFRAYLECEPPIQEVIREMSSIIDDPEADEDDRAMAVATLQEALFPSRSDDDGLLGTDLEREEHEPSNDDRSIRAALDAEEGEFAERVRTILHQRNLTQEQLAAALDIGQPAVSMLLSRQARPQRRTVERVARALGVPPGDLWPGFQSEAAST
jgi:plasmid maintenance system antidote protein VapI